MKDLKRTIKILEEAAYEILTMEYSSWGSANTVLSWEEWWKRSSSEIIYKKIYEEIKQLEEMNKE